MGGAESPLPTYLIRSQDVRFKYCKYLLEHRNESPTHCAEIEHAWRKVGKLL